MIHPPRIAYLIEPRFPGGTSAAIATELRAVAKHARIKVYAYASKMFKGRSIARNLAMALDELGIEIEWDPTRIAADLVIVHNPTFLKFDTDFAPKIVTPHLVVVTHENFVRPGGAEPFDVAHCLNMLERSGLALRKSLAPVSRYNRSTVEGWLAAHGMTGVWDVLENDWHNICAVDGASPTDRPRDRRGRHSRSGFEKFPSMADMELIFPETAEANVILGADLFLRYAVQKPHWQLLPFGSVELPEYFDMIDFMIYFCSPTLRESFGRVVSDATAAGKVVITDADTAMNFGDGVIAARPVEVSDIIARLIEKPALYQEHVRKAQSHLETLSAEAFLSRHGDVLTCAGARPK